MNKNNLATGSSIMVHAYKADGKLYREWKNVFLVEDNDECLILANDNAIITEENNVRKTIHNIAMWYLFKDKWFNIMCLPKKDNKLSFYCNIASPFIIEENTIKYIDYDLDFKVNDKNNFKIIDVQEYKINSEKYKYSFKLINKIDESVKTIKKWVKDKNKYFSHEYANEKYYEYLNDIKK